MNDNDDNKNNYERAVIEELGILVGVAKPDQVTVEAKRPISIGEYVILKYGRGKVLGLVERSSIASDALGSHIRNYEEASESRLVAQANRHDKSYKANVRVLGYLDELKKCKAIIPALPPEPGTQVFEASPDDLRTIFAPEGPQWLRIGTLLRNTEVEARINIDKVVSRHLAVLAMTGMGKSNLVSMLAKEVAKVNGTMVIFDYHDDYSTLEMGRCINLMPAKINPRMLPADKLAEVIEIQENATNQIHVVRQALTEGVRQRKGDDFWDSLSAGVRDVGAEDKIYREAAAKVEDKIDYVRKKFGGILDPGMADPLALIKNGKINIINLVELTEKQANVSVSYYLEELLDDRKRATRQAKNKSPSQQDIKSPPRFTAPVLVVIEEAHIFIPKDEKTETKHFASKVAREGRKFGLGLVIVSQRPRSIDANILSQMGSLAVMRMIQQDDQMQVSAASEALSRDLIDQLPSLNPGEAVFAGQWVNLPAFVKADEVRERKIGGDQKAVEQWGMLAEAKEMAKESSDSYVPSGYIQE
ncbi:putative ATPase [Candidatus Nitrososphaera evergladensis SR1]|uniref:Putative ATPase n=1 Tax=Candidatus Nitrososphaera evergladensis SR1 TaxID=1459636 RepID=A0A075MNJ0_9ARCH|nr:ATP-binding protein [Candidatus Nitrososphaera evergladensis]AIF82768.1 putative ATPase [Candidatus Nitrososphaera evergladensis SR1]